VSATRTRSSSLLESSRPRLRRGRCCLGARRRAAWRYTPLSLLVALLASAAAPASGQVAEPAEGGSLLFSQPHAAFADAYQFDVVRQAFPFTNTGTEAVTIVQTFSVAPDGGLEVRPEQVPPGGTGEVWISQPLGDRLGKAAFRYAIVTDEGEGRRYRMTLSGFVQSAYDPERILADFGRVTRDQGAEVPVGLFSREVARLEFDGAEGLPEFLEIAGTERAGETDEGVTLRLRLLPNSPQGHVAGAFRLRTNVKRQAVLMLHFQGLVLGDVRPSANPVEFGIVETGMRSSRVVELRSQSGRPFRVERVDDPSGRFTISVLPCGGEPSDRGCSRLELATTPAEKSRIAGELQVWIASDPQPIRLRYSGVAVPPGTRVKRIGFDADDPSGADR